MLKRSKLLIGVPNDLDKKYIKLSRSIKSLQSYKLTPLFSMYNQFQHSVKHSRVDVSLKEISPIKAIILQPGVTYSEKGGYKISHSGNNTAECTKKDYFMHLVILLSEISIYNEPIPEAKL